GIEVQARRDFSLERARRSGGIEIRRLGGWGTGQDGNTEFRDLSWAPDFGSGFRRKNLQVEVRPPGRQSAGQGFGKRPGGNHLAKSWFCRGRRLVAFRRFGQSHQPERSDGRGDGPSEKANFFRA